MFSCSSQEAGTLQSSLSLLCTRVNCVLRTPTATGSSDSVVNTVRALAISEAVDPKDTVSSLKAHVVTREKKSR